MITSDVDPSINRPLRRSGREPYRAKSADFLRAAYRYPVVAQAVQSSAAVTNNQYEFPGDLNQISGVTR